MYNVYKAKKNAEVMSGVGHETDIGFLNMKKIQILNNKEMNVLNKIYKEESIYEKKS